MSTSDRGFLQSVAEYYARPEHVEQRQNVVFVLPNKRSALFLKRYIHRTVLDVAIMPRMMTMRTFMSINADYPEATPDELMFLLYTAYRTVMEERRPGSAKPFDAFIFWGDMILSDFDDIDRSLADAEKLYTNLKNVREIQANYLDDTQMEVIRRVWGDNNYTGSGTRDFWAHIHTDEEMGSKFITLWEALADIYTLFHRMLAERHMATPGAQYRQAWSNIKARGVEACADGCHYVFVGFNDLSTAETLIFERFRQLGCATFFWDTAPLHIAMEYSDSVVARPLSRLRALEKNFPMPYDYELPLPSPGDMPEVTVTAVPSNVGQAKEIHHLLSEWAADKVLDPADAINTAVILPDQGLLLPALMTIPADIEKINVSMGLPFRSTNFASLLHSLISMQMRARTRNGGPIFFYDDVCAILTHPYIQLIARKEADALQVSLVKEKLYAVPASRLAVTPELAVIFRPATGHTADEAAAYLTGVLDMLVERFDILDHTRYSGEETWQIDTRPDDAEDDSAEAEPFELRVIRHCRDQIDTICSLVDRYRVDMEDRTFFILFERMLGSLTMAINGAPLEGLQLLGVLETRALDFDNVVILSMNEKIFPRKQYTKTMIPANLRAGYGLPDFDSLEWTYAYAFYRIIARARRVALYYDSRSDGLSMGERSRYISQLRYLMPSIPLTQYVVSPRALSGNAREIVVEKTPEVMEYLRAFVAGGDRALSASSLRRYAECPLKFYLQTVRRLSEPDELAPGVSASELGNIVHKTIQKVFQSGTSPVITAEVMDRWIADEPTIRRYAADVIRQELYPYAKDHAAIVLTPADRVVVEMATYLTIADLKAERTAYCTDGQSFTFVANEMKVSTLETHIPWSLGKNTVNFTMSIDRVDRLPDGTVRLIDFKTGEESTVVDNLETLFHAHKKGGLLQLLIYSQAYTDLCTPAGQQPAPVMPVLHPLRDIAADRGIGPLRINRVPLYNYAAVADRFRPLLEDFVGEIFDPSVPFRQTDDEADCRYCAFRSLCSRMTADK